MRSYRTAPDKARREARARRDLVAKLHGRWDWRTLLEQFNQGEKWPDIRADLGKMKRVSPRTLRRWARLYDGGLDALVPGKSPGAPRTVTGPEMEEAVLGLLFERKQMSNAQVREYLELDFKNGKLPALPLRRHLDRIINRVRAHEEVTLDARHDKKRFRNKHLPAIGSGTAEAKEPNAIWEADASPCDLICSDGKRYRLIGVIDVFSRAIHLKRVPREGALEVLGTLEKAILRLGLPGLFKMDNGKAFHGSSQVRAACKRLGIQLRKLPPYSPEKKGCIERLFRTVTDKLFSQLPGYTGNRVENRPDEIKLELSPEELDRYLKTWTAVYMERPHAGLGGKRPREMRQVPGWRPKMIDPKTLRELLAPREERVVGKKGIILDGRCYWDTREHKLAGYMGKRVWAAPDLDDVSRLSVYDRETEVFICVAESIGAQGVPAQVANEAKKAVKAAARKEYSAVRNKGQVDARFRRLLEDTKRSAPAVIGPKPEIVEHPEAARAVAEKARLEAAEEAQAVNAAPKQPKRYLSPHLLEKLRREVV